MSRWSDAVVNGNTVYFLPGEMYTKTIMTYQATDHTWSELSSPSPHTNCALVVIKNSLTTVGGGGFPYTDRLYTFTMDGRCGLWTEMYPPMPTRRQWAAAVNTGRWLIVAGGWGSVHAALRTVEVMNIDTHEWFTVEGLPEPLFHASMVICGDRLYVLGGYDELKDPSEAVYTCAIKDLLQSMKQNLLRTEYSSRSAGDSDSVWSRVRDVPVTESTAVSVGGQLLAVGGRDFTLKSSTEVYKYSFLSDLWDVISHMTTPRLLCFAAFACNKLIVVGGETDNVQIDSVEAAFTSIM